MSGYLSVGQEIITQSSQIDLLATRPSLSASDVYDATSSPLSRVFWGISWFFYVVLSNTLYYVPTLIISVLSHTFQVNLSFTVLLLFLAVLALATYAYVRYRYLTKYSRLPEEPKRQEPTIDTFLEPVSDNGQSRVSYLDEFLSAIKIFGYLDKSVFHELTKSMQTQKLDSGEILFLDDSSGFTICVEGDIQVYFKIGDETERKQAIFSKDNSKDVVIVDGVRYQLLNNIKSGAPVSSFISVLNLLTNPSVPMLPYAAPTPYGFSTNDSVHHPLPVVPPDGFTLDENFGASSPVASPNQVNGPQGGSLSGPSSVAFNRFHSTNSTPNILPNSIPVPSSSSVELIAIPKGNCTISIIPRESFLRLAVKYPKATTHIIEMILTKLYRVTFQTAHDYLDLTSDIFETEINLNSRYSHKLPRYIRDNIVESLDRQLNNVKDGYVGDEGSDTEHIADDQSRKSYRSVSTPKSNIFVRSSRRFQESSRNGAISASPSLTSSRHRIRRRRRRLSVNQSDGTTTAAVNSGGIMAFSSADESLPSRSASTTRINGNSSRHFSLKSRNNTNPGDLVSNVPLPRRDSEMNLSSNELDNLRGRIFSGDDEESEDSASMAALADAISSMVGIEREIFMAGDAASLTASISSSQLNSHTVSRLTPVNVVPALEQRRGSRLRTYSTTGLTLKGSVDEESEGSSHDSGSMDFDNLKRDLADEIQIVRIAKGSKIIKAGEQTPGIYFVIDGSLDVSYWKRDMEEVDNRSFDVGYMLGSSSSDSHEEYLYTVSDNKIAGYLGTLVGSKSFVDVTATRTTYAAFVPRDVFEFMVERYPRVEACVAKHLLSVLDRRLYLTDYAMEWVHASAGTSLYLQGDPANGIYIVLNGRFRSIRVDKATGKLQILGEHGQGESLGEVEVLTKTRRLVTLVAIRDSELARIPRTLFEMIALSNPSIMVSVSRIVADRVTGAMAANPTTAVAVPNISPHIKDEPLLETFTNFRTLTILPVTQGLPVLYFGERLALALEAIGKSVKMLNQSSALSNLGKHAFDRLAKLKQSGYFAELEEKYDIVMYLVDTIANSSWTRTCIQQGDCILLLADATASPDIGEYERILVKAKTSARTELVLLHPERSVEPGLTNRWLKNRIWVHSHHHLQMQWSPVSAEVPTSAHKEEDLLGLERSPGLLSRSTTKLKNNLRSRMENILMGNDLLLRLTRDSFRTKKYYQPLQAHKNDFMRLARILTGQSIGLVLGGGGARGISHVGVIKALEDNGIPVDMIGGTSIGAFVGGLYAKDYDFVPVYGRAKTFAGRMASIWRSLLDLTIPVTSYITGHEFNRGIWKAFGDSRIEDFWIKYYTNSTNITESLMEVHTSGYAWRYIRASMSLASLVPPLPDNGNMLLDGGYIDNLTVEEMKRRGAKVIIACDVGSADDRTPMDYGDSLSGWWVVLNRLNPFSQHPNVPTMADIQMRLAYVASVSALDRAKNTEGCIYLRPPIEGYATLDFAKFDEIYRVGASYAGRIVKNLLDNDKLPAAKEKKKGVLGGHPLRRRYSV
ncbi:DEKNAAC104563 [Brettanomyces naardenensis]|uniref:Lysophospholipase NTE1 n=1 Tax=Brettanomyces naardenensis TaxID=13370 RepID=A0A448YR60_BRENA|nr:DEKNAAC104563 [Brettanomyces naardenensis]